jgi:DNA-binding NarL/FixJ family response regulator
MARPLVFLRPLGGRDPESAVPAGPESDEQPRHSFDDPTEVVLADATDIGTAVDAVLRGRDAIVWLTGDRTLRALAIDELGRIADIVDEQAEGSAVSGDRDARSSRSVIENLDPEHQRLIALVANGSTIIEAAREIGLSRRTAARRMATVRSVLGVDSNAEAVVVWISHQHDTDRF